MISHTFVRQRLASGDSGGGAVGRAKASDTRGLRFESHLQHFFPPLPYYPLFLLLPRPFLTTHFFTTWLSRLGLVTRWAQPLITSNYNLLSTTKDRSTMRAELTE